jgi:hypothetical protein
MKLKDLLKLTNEARREDILCIIGYGVNFNTKSWVRTGEGNKHEVLNSLATLKKISVYGS